MREETSFESLGDWGFFADEQPETGSSEESDEESRSSSNSSAASTAGLAELNTWLWDSCELGVAAWMHAGVDAKRGGRRRCYFMTGAESDWRCYGHYQPTGGAPGHLHNVRTGNPDRHHEDAGCFCVVSTRPRRHLVQRSGRRRQLDARRAAPQQLWCVTPFDPDHVRASRWESIETVMTPRLCPRVFSREFAGGVIVGASFGSIRVVRNRLTGLRASEFLMMVSVGDRCRRAWRRQSHFAVHARAHWARWAPACRAAWAIAEADRRWLPSHDDFPYIAARQAALEAVLREILFSAESPAELLDLSGNDRDNLGPPPSLAEVKTRPSPRGATANHLPANDADYAALFGGEFTPPSSPQNGLRALGDAVLAPLAGCQKSAGTTTTTTKKTICEARRIDARGRRACDDDDDDDDDADSKLSDDNCSPPADAAAEEDENDAEQRRPANAVCRRRRPADLSGLRKREDALCVLPSGLARALFAHDGRKLHRRRDRYVPELRKASKRDDRRQDHLLPPLVAALRPPTFSDNTFVNGGITRPREPHPLFAPPLLGVRPRAQFVAA